MPSPSAEPVKEAIDAQSGRFEFFKQALTLGSAGIAGLAAILTDETKIPQTILRKLLVAGCGVLLLATIVAAVWGISVYANLLTRLQDEGGRPPTAGAKRTSATARASVVTHARATFVTLSLAALMLFVYAAVLLATGPTGAKPTDETRIALIASAQKTAADALAAANKNTSAISSLTSDQEKRFTALESSVRQLTDDHQKHLDLLGQKLTNLEQLVRDLKPAPHNVLTLYESKRIQQALTTRGFKLGRIDGIFGSKTIAAIRDYQAQRPDHPAITGSLTDEQIQDLLRRP